MKIFLSWSGETSHRIAVILRDWIPLVIQSIKPYVSSEDIDKGARWSVDIGTELENSNYGILCVTKDNLSAPWLNFEAGALSKSFSSARVSPFLFNLEASDLAKSPLLQFQGTRFDKVDVLKLLHSINGTLDSQKLDEIILSRIFDQWWPELQTKLNELPAHKEKPKNKESEVGFLLGEAINEILTLTREQYKVIKSNADSKERKPEYRNNISLRGDAKTALLKVSEARSKIEYSRKELTDILDIIADKNDPIRNRILNNLNVIELCSRELNFAVQSLAVYHDSIPRRG